MTTTTVRELKDLQDQCDKLGIEYDRRNKAASLQTKIDEKCESYDPCEDLPVEDCQAMMEKNDEYTKSKGGDTQRARAMEALGYFSHVHIGNATSIREYLVLLEAKAGV